MKLLQTITSNHGFRDPEHNAARLEMLNVILHVAKAQGAALVILPGGYLTVEAVAYVPDAIDAVARRADAAEVVVIGGVDVVCEERTSKSAPVPELPYYGFAVGPVEPVVADLRWTQTSSTGENADGVADADVPGESRVVDVGGWRVGVLICGELFSEWARAAFAQLRLKLALDLGHESMGTGVTRAMENIATNGNCAVAHTHHVAPHSGGSLHFVRSDGVRESIPLETCDWHGEEGAFWAAWCVREV